MENFTQLFLEGIVWYGVFIISAVLHEASHAFAALKLGDRTAYYGGQVGVDPIPHMQREPIGMMLIPWLSFFLNGGSWMIGWASVPYDPEWAYQYPRRSALMALAGPLANLALVVASMIAIRVGLMLGFFVPPDAVHTTQMVVAAPGSGLDSVAFGLSILMNLNLVLFVFNLLPVPPLDGSAIVQLFMKPRQARRYMRWLRESGLAMLGLLVAWFGFRYIFWPIQGAVINLLYLGITSYH